MPSLWPQERLANRCVRGLVAVLLVALARPAFAVIRFTGVNLSGAEFGAIPTPGDTGTYGEDYIYPKLNEVTYFMGKGMNAFRLPFRWERMQHSKFGALDTTELARMDAFVTAATNAGATVILDPHNFQRYYPDPENFQESAQGLVGVNEPNELVDFWKKMAEHYKNNGRVIFNLMNEPAWMPTEQLVTTTNLVIAGIRGTGATNIIHVPGNGYTGAWTWQNNNWYGTANAAAMLNIVDSAQNMVFEVHQYIDSDGSGGVVADSTLPQIGSQANPNNTNVGAERLADFTAWLQTNHRRGFLGEFALPNDRFGTGSKTTGATVNRSRIADETLQAMMNYMNLHADVWEGWDWWGGGPWWNKTSYQFGLEPVDNNVTNPAPADEAEALPYLQPYMVHAFTQFAGDFNQDDVVDAKDLILYKMSAGRSGFHLAADGNNDGKVDGADLLLWQRTLGRNSNSPTAAGVPEPPAVALIMLAISGALAARRP